MINSFIWCYRKDCIFNTPTAEDSEGKFGLCKKEEVIIGRYGKCSSEKIAEIDIDKTSDMLQETQDYKKEVERINL